MRLKPKVVKNLTCSISVDCALQNNKKRATLLNSWARNFRYLLRLERKTQNNRKMMKRCTPPAYLDDTLTGALNRIQYSNVGTHLAPLQILNRLEEIYNVIVEIQFSDGCMVKTLLRRKKQVV